LLLNFAPKLTKLKADSNTEDKIKEAAKQVFIAKGFSGCTSREIAKAAGMNVALVNYYFRSKSALFKIIFEAAMGDFLLSMLEVFNTSLSLEEKLRNYLSREYEFLAKYPEIPSFIINEMGRKDGVHIDNTSVFKCIEQTGIFEECKIEQQAGRMRKIDIASITLLMMSNCQFPFMGAAVIKQVHGISDEQYEKQLVQHKQIVTDMLIGYLFPRSKTTQITQK
jgi:TetR/AcrR family transcriptional regulator